MHYCDGPKQSWFSKVRKCLDLNRTIDWFLLDPLRYILIGDESVLIYSVFSNEMHIFSIRSLVDEEEQPDINLEVVFSTMSSNGDFAYLNNKCSQRLTIYNLQSNTECCHVFQNRNSEGCCNFI